MMACSLHAACSLFFTWLQLHAHDGTSKFNNLCSASAQACYSSSLLTIFEVAHGSLFWHLDWAPRLGFMSRLLIQISMTLT